MGINIPIKDYDYKLPKKLIANKPVSPRDHSKLLILDRTKKIIKHDYFYNIYKYLPKDCVLVLNKTKVIPARLYAKINQSKVEILLEKRVGKDSFNVLVKPGKKFKIGKEIIFSDNLKGIVDSIYDDGTRKIKFNLKGKALDKEIDKNGEPPFPPYIKNSPVSLKDYQTVYAKNKGSIAAPTAGLHFTKKLLADLKSKGIGIEYVTLHVGRGTFEPVKTENILDHKMHYEWVSITKKTADTLNDAKKQNKKIIAVGTTSVRALESAAQINTVLKKYLQTTNLFIYPGYKYKFVDAMITNFHLPKSTLLLLISAMASKKLIFKAYKEAIKKEYRFFSFGDSMLII